MPDSKGSARKGGTSLVIVESPAKARTIAGYLGGGYVVESSIGHIRDLPDKAAEIPTRYKKEPWARLGVNVDHEFEPLYVVNADKKQQVKKLKDLLTEADELLLATDEDREGEAIAWHLREVLKPKVPVRRMVFNEITREAIQQAARNPRDLNLRLVDAQETRRILDRLYGYEVSPVLWKKVMPRLSAGRVQSVATRLVVERERERIAFVPAHYWDIVAEFTKAGAVEVARAGGSGDAAGNGDGPERGAERQPSFTANLVSLDGRRIAQGRDFTPRGELKSSGLLHLDEEAARGLAGRLGDSAYAVKSVERKPYRRSPYAPFRTTTLQQEASRKLGFSAKYTMQIAQKLYENGFITYMRTDSVTLSETAVAAARAQARQLYGADYVPDKPRVYQSKVKNAQEAHEAIRPAGDSYRTPGETGLTGDQFRLYELIWKRTIACQMKDATGQSVSVRIAGRSSAGEEAEFAASGKTITFYGFLRAYVESADDPEADRDDRERRLPELAEEDPLAALSVEAAGHSTRPPARYTEASLVKELEDREIGRPSTYATIIGTILDRGYVFKKGTALVPSFLAFAVVNLLEKHFGNLVDYDFTARMEDCLDAIARGETERVPWLRRFYFGDKGEDGLKELVTDLGEIDAKEVSSFPVYDSDIVIRVGRYGPYLERDGSRVNIPEDLAPDELTVDKAEELFAQPSGDRPLGVDPRTGYEIVAKTGRFGPYVTELRPEDAPAEAESAAAPSGKGAAGQEAKPAGKSGRTKASGKSASKTADKPRTSSLFKSMSLDTVTLDDALALLSLPRVLGELDGEQVTAQNGRYGPYVKKGTDSRSLEREEELFTITIEQAKALFDQPKRRGRGRAAAAPPLRELGDDPASGKPVVVKDGRFGPYVTDGETNASLRRGDSVEEITLQRAAELLAERREKVASGAAGSGPRRSTGSGKGSSSRQRTGRASGSRTGRGSGQRTGPRSG